MRVTCLALALGLVGCAHRSATAWAPIGPAVGMMSIEVSDPLTRQPLPSLVLYPPTATVASGFTDLGPYRVEAIPALAVAEGRHPLIVISHGHLGSRLGHHDLGEALARAGYIVAAVQHQGDSYDDDSAVGTDRAMLGRAYQLSATIDAMLAHPTLGPHVDPDRIGVAGFSAGGYTSLLVAGAVPDFSLHAGYCQRHPRDAEICSITELKKTITGEPKPTADARVKAAFVMAPLAIFFRHTTLDAVKVPVFLAWSMGDEVLLPAENAEPVRDLLTSLAGTRVIDRAGHYVFLSPCSDEMTQRAPAICVDAPGVDRAAIHRQLSDDAITFFNRSLPADVRQRDR